MIPILQHLFSFFSIIPVGKYDYDEEKYRKALYGMGLVGVVLSFFLLIVYYLFQDLTALQPIMLLLTYVLLSGGIHLDGYSDTLDGILSRSSRERTLEIMKDSRLGTFGMLGLFFLLILYIVLLYDASKAFLLFPIVGRFNAHLSNVKHHYAREKGMGKLFMEEDFLPLLFLETAIFSGIVIFLLRFDYFVVLSLLVSYLSTLLMVFFFERKLGGMTGDTVGFSIEFSQLVYLFLLYLWR
ncbi:adenosylcobinamide-GDP ribazoletransferase [Guggenheimella bovis]